ncbi:efflux RND transporter periplasmic adaptor subunit [Comamonas sp. GB3 AK4-5]|uniref:efflux RND transporter periplasmic adaptor subunit n=1 Tax=Comamonas sp. GB3 AK4-5 TaxID=3231487 RepID=UPI00351DB9B0
MSPRTRRRIFWALVMLMLLGLGVGGWRSIQTKRNQQQDLHTQQTASAPPLRATAQDWLTLVPRSLPLQVPISGTLTAVDSGVVKARVSGELKDLALREGDSVRKGQVIARVDATESEARWRQAKLQADAAQAQVEIQQRQFDNNRALVAQQFISPTALSTSQANLRGALANYAAAQAAADAARKVLDDTVLRSPIDGQIARRWVQNGERVNADASVVEVVNLGALELQAPLPAQDSLQVLLGQNATLQVEGNALAFSAQVVRISPSAQSGSRAVPVFLRMQPNTSVQLRPGMFVQGHIDTGRVTALAVPLDAVRNDQPQPYVQLVLNGAVLHRPVQLGVQAVPADSSNQAPWVAVQGLAEDSTVLLASMGPLPEGSKVDFQQPPAPAAAR